MDNIIDEFIRYLRIEKGLSKNTLLAYHTNILSFYSFYESIHNNKSDLTIPIVNLQECMKYCSVLAQGGASASTIAQHISTLKSFFIFLERKNYIHENPLLFLSLPKQHKKIPSILTVEEIEILLASPQQDTKLGKRDKVLLELLYATGMRVSELCDLSLLHLDIERGFIRVHGKGNKERFIPLYHGMCELLKEYIRETLPLFCPIDTTLFVNRSGTKLSRQAVFLLLQKYAQHAGIKKSISPHSIRHSFASHMIENGADIRTVQVLLGHEDISTTEVYLQLRIEHIMNMHEQYHPRNI